MANDFFPQVMVTADATGAYLAGKRQNVVIIVDVIDMSTTLESALEAGAAQVYGASPSLVKVPLPVDPERIGYEAGVWAVENNCPVVIVAEPRWGTEDDFIKTAQKALKGLQLTNAFIEGFYPNLGASTTKLCDFHGKVVLAVTDTGGVAFDAAYNAGGTVITGTVARTYRSKGVQPALNVVQRALRLANYLKKDISVVAASANSLEDVLAAQYIGQKILEQIRAK